MHDPLPSGSRDLRRPVVGEDLIPCRLLLLGLMGSGKTTVGRAVAERCGWTYVDNDREIAAMAGASTVELAARGGDELHAWEATYARRVGEMPAPLVAGLPGSVADRPELLSALRGYAVLVYLRCDVDTLLTRVAADAPRPWLGSDPRPFVQRTWERRDPVLRECSTHVVDARGPAERVVDAVLRLLAADDLRATPPITA
jgi:shikimate kinase